MTVLGATLPPDAVVLLLLFEDVVAEEVGKELSPDEVEEELSADDDVEEESSADEVEEELSDEDVDVVASPEESLLVLVLLEVPVMEASVEELVVGAVGGVNGV